MLQPQEAWLYDRLESMKVKGGVRSDDVIAAQRMSQQVCFRHCSCDGGIPMDRLQPPELTLPAVR